MEREVERLAGANMGEETRIGTIAIASFIGTFYIFSSFTPIIATELLASTGASWSISLYIVVLAAISLFSVLLLSETYSKDLSDIEAGSRGPVMAESDPATGSPGSG